MHWYGGSIAEAVNLSKQKNAIFVVFVEGDNELSAEMAATIDNTDVLTRLSDETNFLAVKLKSGSGNYTHFAQIYQFVPVPSLFFIGRNGTPLEVVCAGVQPQNLATRIDRILEEHNKELPGCPVQPSTSSQNIKEQTENFLQMEAAPIPAGPTLEETKPDIDNEPEATPPKVAKTEHAVNKSDQEYEVVCDGDMCVRRPVGASEEPGPSHAPTPTPASPLAPQEIVAEPAASTADIEEKMERAKELIEAKRREKADKEKEAEKEKEMERRATGKGVAELKRWQADQELKNIQEERKREKMENDLARQRILAQIAQDRAERRARDAPAPPPAQTSAPPAVPATSGDAGSRARIQFKLPDGTSHTAHFDADNTLETVHRYVADNLQMSATSFSLWTAFPRRELTDSSATLRSLQLAPSAALLVLATRPTPTVARPSAIVGIIAFLTQLFSSIILEPSQQMIMWLRTRIFPPPAGPRAASPPGASPTAASPPAAPQQPPSTLRRRGNIHRLPSDRQSDDENNTWNGNSTQQM